MDLFLALCLALSLFIVGRSEGKMKKSGFHFRLERSLPSVSENHFQELAPDGTYRYAYTGQDSYHAERRLADGTVEGETVYLRPDGVPIKVHYFSDAKSGFRPTTELLYDERLRFPIPVELPVPTPRAHLPDTPSLYLASPGHSVVLPQRTEEPQVNGVVEGNKITIGNNAVRSGDDVAISSPSVTAIIGPGGRAELRPHSVAHTEIARGGISISNPSSTAVIGPGGSAVLAPLSSASTGATHLPSELGINPSLLRATQPRRIWTPTEVTDFSPSLIQRSSQNVLIVPSQPSYEYTYTYSSPDSKFPLRDSSAFVTVRVNQ